MDKILDRSVATSNTINFNFNKLQAAMCIGASASVSIGLLYWAVSSFF
jgi:hypothetical protein